MNLFKSVNFNAVLAGRFKTALEEKKLELERLTERKNRNGEGGQIQHLKQAVENTLRQASESIKAKDLENGWNYLHIAEEYMADLLLPEELAVKANTLREEAARLNERRKLTILSLLSAEQITITAYVEALRLRNDFYNTKYHKINLRRAVMMRLLAMMVVLVGVIVCMTYFDVFKKEATNWQEAWPATVLGMLGAALSMSYTLTNKPLDEKIPDQIIGSFVVWIRVAIGGAAAFVTILIGQSGLLGGILNEKILTAPYAHMIIAFVSGFSERLFIRVIQVMSNEQATVITQGSNAPSSDESNKSRPNSTPERRLNGRSNNLGDKKTPKIA